ncbi:hypothetical protein Emed_005424 [Eimeria media]
MAAGKRQQQLFLGFLCLCCCKAAATPATAGNLRLEEAALLGRDAAAAERQAVEDDSGLAAALAAAIENSSNSSNSGRLLRNGGPGSGLLPQDGETVGVLRYNSVEVPDWTHGIHDKPQDPSEEDRSPRQRPTLDFKGPLPPMGAWVPASFTNYGKRHPMGPLLIACSLKPPNTATCEVLHDGSRSGRNVALYRAWSMWGDRAKGQAYVSLLSGSITGATLQGASEEQQMSCCENTNNSEGCVACTGLPSTSYNPLNIDSHMKEVERTETEDRPHSYAPPSRYPISQSADPVEASELFDILPNLKEQLGADADDLTMVESMVKTSHIQQLIPCEMTFVAVTDDKARDFQGQKPPACLADALNRPENQRDMLKLVGRNALLGRKDPLPVSADVPLLYGKPAHTGLWGDRPTWNNTQLTGEKILFDRGVCCCAAAAALDAILCLNSAVAAAAVIHLLSRNDMNDPDSRELLRKIVYWSCLHDHLVHHPSLTRFALIMVDNRRALPIIGTPPGPRPDWVARGNQGWFAPPKAKAVGDEDSDEDDESEEEARDTDSEEEEEEKRPDGKPEDDAETKQKPEEEAEKPKPEEEANKPKPQEEADKPKPVEEAEKEAEKRKPEDDEAAAKQKPEEEKEKPKPEEEAARSKPEEEKPKPEDEAEARQKPEDEADRPKPEEEEKRPEPEEKAAPKQKPEDEAEKPKPEAASKPKPEEEEEKPEAREEKEAERPKPEEEAKKPEPEEKEENRPEPREEEEADRPKPEKDDASRPKADDERKDKPEPEKERDAAPRQESDEEREREKAEEEKRRPKPEEAKKPGQEDEAEARKRAEEEAARPKPEEDERKDDKRRPDEKEAGRPEEEKERQR